MPSVPPLVLLLSLAGLAAAGASAADRPWMAKPLPPPSVRAAALLAQMELEEKLAMLHGTAFEPYVGFVPANTRLGIPALHLEDGPQGVADGTTNVTCWPSALAVTATWDTDLMNSFAAAQAAEQRIKGTNIMLGPMVNIARVPFGGRNFESTGEDPYLAAQMAAASVGGIQSQGVMGCVKHWALNNQEYNRTTTSADGVSLRTAYEIYYPAFQAAIEAGVGSVMCSYNRINDTWACENPETLTRDLKGAMGFQGFVMSDWGATHSTVPAANAGLDMEMPSDQYFGQALASAVASGQVSAQRVDDMVTRILTPMFAVGLFDQPQTGNLSANALSPAHDQLARDLSAASTVLVKNDGYFLPLPSNRPLRVAISGDDALLSPVVASYGSGSVIAPYVVSPFEGISQRLNGTGSRLSYSVTSEPQQAALYASEADVAIVFVSAVSSEGIDRTTLALTPDQDALVEAVTAAQPNTVVVCHVPGAVLMPWISLPRAVLVAWMPGQESGNAIADVLFGDVNPSARLPVTFPATDNQTCVSGSVEQYPGVDNEAQYSEGLLVGYRWYDQVGENPLFPFGHGLSYSVFDYSNLVVNASAGGYVTVSFVHSLAQGPAGFDVPQLYLGFPEEAGEPPLVLRRFSKVQEVPEVPSSTVTWQLGPADFSVFDEGSMSFTPVSGVFTIFVGASSRDIRLKATVEL